MTRSRLFTFVPSEGKFDVVQCTNRPIAKPFGSIAAYKRYIHDVIMFVVTCKVHRKVLLKNFQKSCYYLPFFPLQIGEAWHSQIEYRLECFLKASGLGSANISVQSNLLQVNQIRLPKYADFLHQLVCLVELDYCTGQCSKNTSQYKWFAIEQVTPNNVDIWGPEPHLYATRANNQAKCSSMSCEKVFISKKWTLARSIDYTEEDAARLYSEYLQHCYPSMLLNQYMFIDYMTRSKMNVTVNSKVHNPTRMYSAFCLTSGLYASYKEILFNLVALERRCMHGGVGGELRTRGIFRYYTKLGATRMTLHELEQFYEDIIDSNNIKYNRKKFTLTAKQLVEELFKQMKMKKEEGLSLEEFIEMVGSLMIRGTACIYRSAESPLTEIRSKGCYEMLIAREVKLDRLDTISTFKRNKRCHQCDRQVYSMAIHSIFFNTNDEFVVHYQQELPSDYTTQMAQGLRNRSLETINPTNVYNELRTILRQFSVIKYCLPKVKLQAPPSGLKWEKKEDRAALVDKILKICLYAKDYFRKGPRMLRCTSPIFVFGDIHGNFRDLMIYDHQLWRMAPHGYVCNSLFLGDYVDRGDSSVECVLYLLCMKMLLPDKIHLLRGNHEMRPVQQQFTFYRECLDKFGMSLGANVWEACNQVFDCMPLCALVDEQIFCAHGGIPASSTRLETLPSIPISLPNPMLNKVAWEILWNDPVNRAQYKDFLDMCPQQECFPLYPAGYLPNLKRGTAFYYSEDAVDYFLEQNGLGQIIRAHEVIPFGYLFTMQGKVVTIFSSSNYCGSQNEAAVVFIEAGKMRVLKIETFKTFE